MLHSSCPQCQIHCQSSKCLINSILLSYMYHFYYALTMTSGEIAGIHPVPKRFCIGSLYISSGVTTASPYNSHSEHKSLNRCLKDLLTIRRNLEVIAWPDCQYSLNESSAIHPTSMSNGPSQAFFVFSTIFLDLWFRQLALSPPSVHVVFHLWSDTWF
jgi:hypothetical protein